MGVGCQVNNIYRVVFSENDKDYIQNVTNNNIKMINDNELNILKKVCEKIQLKYKSYLSKKKLQLLFNEQKEKTLKILVNKKLINNKEISESKSEQLYQKLLSEKKIKKFKEIIEKNISLNNKLNTLKNYCFDFPFYIQTKNNEIYKGSFNCNKHYHGYGVVYEFNPKNKKNSRTEGIFTNGFLCGYGRIFLSDGEIFMGEFMYNKLNGLGTYIKNDGEIYKGSFFEGLPQGNGRELFSDGSRFEGFYLAGKKKTWKVYLEKWKFL